MNAFGIEKACRICKTAPLCSPRLSPKKKKKQHVRALVSKPGAEAAHGFPVSLLDIAAANPRAAAALLSWPSEGLDALTDALLEAQEAAVAQASEAAAAAAEADTEGGDGGGGGGGGLAENILSVSVKARAAVRLLPPPAPLLPLLSAGNALGGNTSGSGSGSSGAAKPGGGALPSAASLSRSFPLSRLRAQHAGALV